MTTTTRRFAPQFPVLAYADGEKCGHWQHRGDRPSLRCVRPVHGSEINHLHDVDPRLMLTKDEYEANAARQARVTQLSLNYGRQLHAGDTKTAARTLVRVEALLGQVAR
jgi:hypothetical protein